MATSKAAEVLSSSPDLWNRYRARFARKTGDADDAGDLVGLLLERVWRYVERNGAPESLEALAYVIYRRLVVDYVRSKNRRRNRERMLLEGLVLDNWQRAGSPEEQKCLARWRAEVRAAVVPYARTRLQCVSLQHWDASLEEQAATANSTPASMAVSRCRLAGRMRKDSRLRELLSARPTST